MVEGWIKLSRSIENHWIYKDPLKLKWWIDILINVSFKDSKINIGNQLIECKRGQSIMSLSSWGERWGVSKDKVRNFFILLEKDGMITHENVLKSTRITVCNYDSYQSVLHDSQTQSKRNPNAIQTQSHPLEEGKESEEGKEKKEISIDTRSKLIDDILLFFCFKPDEPKSIPHKREINRFLTEIIKEGLLEVFTDQYDNFKKVKAENPKFNYSLKNFLFSDSGEAAGGQWNAFDWSKKMSELKIQDDIPDGAKNRIEQIKQMNRRNEAN